jgi:hypothetical protein
VSQLEADLKEKGEQNSALEAQVKKEQDAISHLNLQIRFNESQVREDMKKLK